MKEKKRKKESQAWFTTIQIDLFKTGIIVIVAKDRESVLNILPTIYGKLELPDAQEHQEGLRRYWNQEEDTQEQTLGEFLTVGSVMMAVYYGESPKDIALGTVIHEMAHATQHICRVHGVEDDETGAYMVEYLCGQFLDMREELAKDKKNTHTNKTGKTHGLGRATHQREK